MLSYVGECLLESTLMLSHRRVRWGGQFLSSAPLSPQCSHWVPICCWVKSERAFSQGIESGSNRRPSARGGMRSNHYATSLSKINSAPQCCIAEKTEGMSYLSANWAQRKSVCRQLGVVHPSKKFL